MAKQQRQRVVDPKRAAHRPRKADSILEEQVVLTEPSTPAILERAAHRPRQMTPGDTQRLQRAFGNRAVTRLVAGAPAVQASRDPSTQILSRSRAGNVQPTITQMPKSGLAGQGNKVVQRRIQFNGVDVDLGSLLKRAKDMKERVILANWGWSDIVHNFRRSKKHKTPRKALVKAVESAKSQVKDVPPLYKAGNLMFLTKAGGRLPTLYFRSGNDSGRIRQQHRSGPMVGRETNKIDYFFPDKARMDKFGAATKKARAKDKAFKPWLWRYKAKLTPRAGYSHYEVTYKGSKKIAKVHPSGGLVDLDLRGYNDTRIKSIYQRVIGSIT